MIKVAAAAASKMKVLCLDELFVTDVADAAILSRLFGHMWDKGIILVATSNRSSPPLYSSSGCLHQGKK